MVALFKNRLLVTSITLAAAGLLTCAAALLDAILPWVSLAAFLGWLFAAGAAIIAIMVSFAWTCEKVDQCSRSRQRGQDHHAGSPRRAATGAWGSRPGTLVDGPSRRVTLIISPRLHYYPLTPRGAMSPVDLKSVRTRFAQ
jgi:hypothetical protein